MTYGCQGGLLKFQLSHRQSLLFENEIDSQNCCSRPFVKLPIWYRPLKGLFLLDRPDYKD
jgi:hypothetical protein